MNDIATVAKKCSVAESWRKIVDGYSGHVSAYLKWCESREPSDYRTVLDYFNYLDASTYRRGTVRAKRVAIKSRLRLAARTQDPMGRMLFEERIRDLDKDCPTPKVEIKPISRAKCINRTEFIKCLRAAGPRQAGLFLFGWFTGCRVSEVINIRLRDCVPDGMGLVVIKIIGKGKQEGETEIKVPLFNDLCRIYQGKEYLFETASGRPYGRVQASDAVKRLTKRVLGRPLSYHKLRHSLATRLVDKGVPISAVSRKLRHKSVSTTASYYVHVEVAAEQVFDAGDDQLLNDVVT